MPREAISYIREAKMTRRFFIITGTSSGIGEAIAQSLLELGDTVCGISRRESGLLASSPRYNHIKFNLQQHEQIEGIVNQALEQVSPTDIAMVCLINNAAMCEPFLPIENCHVEDIKANLNISLTAPICLTSAFIRATENWSIRRKVINISSGSAIYANLSMSIYSTAKAGLDMFTRCVGVEQKNKSNPVEIIADNRYETGKVFNYSEG
jgi:benzil reductase ((S)-benzoin forming)